MHKSAYYIIDCMDALHSSCSTVLLKNYNNYFMYYVCYVVSLFTSIMVCTITIIVILLCTMYLYYVLILLIPLCVVHLIFYKWAHWSVTVTRWAEQTVMLWAGLLLLQKNLGQVFMSDFRTFLGHIFTRHPLHYYNNLQWCMQNTSKHSHTAWF